MFGCNQCLSTFISWRIHYEYITVRSLKLLNLSLSVKVYPVQDESEMFNFHHIKIYVDGFLYRIIRNNGSCEHVKKYFTSFTL